GSSRVGEKLATSQEGLIKALRERDSASRKFSSSSRLASKISHERDDLRMSKEELERSYDFGSRVSVFCGWG
ncbi:hypothetical protein MKX03_013098, partial [Papaver bracteatum]